MRRLADFFLSLDEAREGESGVIVKYIFAVFKAFEFPPQPLLLFLGLYLVSNVIQVATTEKYPALTSSNTSFTFSTASGTWKALQISFVATASFDDQNASCKTRLISGSVRAGICFEDLK